MLVETEWITGYRYCVLVDTEQITGYRHCVIVGIEWIRGQIVGYSGET